MTNRTVRTALLIVLAVTAAPLAASTLSVAELSKALQNPELVTTIPDDLSELSDEFTSSAESVTGMLLNQPVDDAERRRLYRRLSNLARYRNTRVGKLFFTALDTSPAIENLPEGAESAELITTWPMAFESQIRLRVAFVPAETGWLISALEVTASGVGAASLSGLAPYFGSGEINAEFLDLEPFDYLVGRDPKDREKPENEREEFDFDSALTKRFATEAGAFEATINDLITRVTPETSDDDRKKALKEHLATDAEIETLEAVTSDPENRLAFWARLIEQLKKAGDAPRPGSVPSADGAEVSVRFRTMGADGTVEAVTSALRLGTGKIAVRGGVVNEEHEDGEAG